MLAIFEVNATLAILALFENVATAATLAIFENSANDAVIAVGTQAVPFQSNPYPAVGGVVTVSTSASALILAAVKLAYALAFV